MFKQEKGITLVSLVITIIVMLILAGVSLSMVMGDSSVLDQATQAVDETERSTVKDEIALAVGAVQTAYYGQYSNTTGRLTMAQCLETKLNKNDFTSASKVELVKTATAGTYYLIYTHTNGNVYQTQLTVTSTSITVEANGAKGAVVCVTRNGATTNETAVTTATSGNEVLAY